MKIIEQNGNRHPGRKRRTVRSQKRNTERIYGIAGTLHIPVKDLLCPLGPQLLSKSRQAIDRDPVTIKQRLVFFFKSESLADKMAQIGF